MPFNPRLPALDVFDDLFRLSDKWGIWRLDRIGRPNPRPFSVLLDAAAAGGLGLFWISPSVLEARTGQSPPADGRFQESRLREPAPAVRPPAGDDAARLNGFPAEHDGAVG